MDDMTLTSMMSLVTTTSKYGNCILKSISKLCFGRVLKRSLSAHLMQVKLLLFTFYLNGELHAVSNGKPSERRSNFWTIRFIKSWIRTEFRFSAHPYFLAELHAVLFSVAVNLWMWLPVNLALLQLKFCRLYLFIPLPSECDGCVRRYHWSPHSSSQWYALCTHKIS